MKNFYKLPAISYQFYYHEGPFIGKKGLPEV
jgi:hypothetical protein